MRKLKDVDMQLQRNKVTNLRLACARLDGLLLRPGETMSYWYLIGKPTAGKGYLPGMIQMCIRDSGWVKEGQYDKILQEINSVKISCHGNILKVIIETCLLTDEEKIKLCEVVSNSHADYIKTSTGFAGGGATREDVALMAAHMTNGKKIKAAGGIASLQDAEDFLKLGADRLGTSRIVKAVKELEAKGEL